MYLGLDWLLIALGFRVRMVVGVVVVFVFFLVTSYVYIEVIL